MSLDLTRRNDATNVNPNIFNGVVVQENITVRGSSFYFAICSIMGFTALTVLGLSYMKPRTDRIFFYITAALNFTAFIAYFTMGSNLGWVPIDVEFRRTDPIVRGVNRSIFYTRYIDWVITTPLLLMDLLLTAGLPWPTILYVIFWDEVMIITGLVGALVSTRYKWGYWTIGTVAMFYVFYQLAFVGRKHANALGKDVGRAFTLCGVLTLIVWLCYPICWGVAEGGNVISSDSEAIFYGVLDFLAKPVFSAALIYSHWNISPSRMGLSIREFGSVDEKVQSEKHGVDDHDYGQNSSHTDGNHIAPAPPTGQLGSNTATTTGTNAGAHAGHRVGYTPGHEHATHEGPPHTV